MPAHVHVHVHIHMHSNVQGGGASNKIKSVVLNVSLPSRSSQLTEPHTNKIKHDIHPE